jgi:hypothetical protein
MQKVIRIADNDTSKLDVYLSDGWEVKNMTACAIDSRIYFSVCYILIEKK